MTIERIVFLHRIKTCNVGDLAAGPYRYLDFGLPVEVRDINNFRAKDFHSRDLLIVGGGGLFGNSFFLEGLRQIDRFVGPIVIWSAGLGSGPVFLPSSPAEKTMRKFARTIRAKWRNWCEQIETQRISRNVVRKAELCGLRSKSMALDTLTVPCVSCLSPIFDTAIRQSPTNDFVAIQHASFPLNVNAGVSRLTNTEGSMEDIVQLIASARGVITSSYHAMYWAQLLGKTVWVNSWSTKFELHPWPFLRYESLSKASETLLLGEVQPRLSDARILNQDFACRVAERFGLRFTLKT